MTIAEIIQISDITEAPNYLTHDSAVPIGTDGKYPHAGKAITLYYRSGGCGIVSHKVLIAMARQNVEMKLSFLNMRAMSAMELYKLINKYIVLSNELLDSGFHGHCMVEYVLTKLNKK